MLKQEERTISCPYCGEMISVLIDCSSGSQEYYEDCSVCCAPILFSVSIDALDEIADIEVKRDND
jgi:transcription elongation factor Elf1